MCCQVNWFFNLESASTLKQGAQVRMLCRENEKNFANDGLALTSMFGSCFIQVCQNKSNCYSLTYSSLGWPKSKKHNHLSIDIII